MVLVKREEANLSLFLKRAVLLAGASVSESRRRWSRAGEDGRGRVLREGSRLYLSKGRPRHMSWLTCVVGGGVSG